MFSGSPTNSKVPLITTLVYAVAAIAFVFVTNLVLSGSFENKQAGLWVQIAVDLGFVLITSGVIYVLVSRAMRRRGQVEAELRANSDLLAKAGSIAHMATWHWDYATDKITWSDEMYELYGVSRSEFNGDPDDLVRRTVHPDDLERVLEFNKQVRSQHKPLAGEYRVVLPTGEVRNLFGDGANVYNKNGEAISLIGVIQDITEHKKIENDLRLRGAALEAAANAIVITDRAGDILWVNPGFVTLTGYTPEAILGKNIRLLNTLQHDAVAYEALWAKILAGEVWQGETVNQRRDGSLYIEEQTITPVRDGQGRLTHFVAISQDVSARRQAEDALRESEDRFRKLAERIPDIIYRFRLLPEQKLEYVSPAITSITGYTPEELYQHPEIFAAGVHPEDREAFATAEQQPVVALRIFAKDGRVIWLEQRHVPEFNEAGEIVAVDGVAREITERVQRQNELEAIARVSAVLSTASSRAEMLPLVLDEIRDMTGAADASIFTYDLGANDLVVELGRGEYASQITGKHLPLGGNISSQVLETGKPFITNDIRNSPNFKWMVTPPAAIWAAVCVPLLVETEAIGVLWVYHSVAFSDEELKLLRTLANIMGTALQRVTLHEQSQQRTRQLAILNETGNALAETLDLPTILHRLAGAAQKLLPQVTALFVSLYEADTSLIRVIYGMRNNEAVGVKQLVPSQFNINGLDGPSVVIRTGQPLIVNDMTAQLPSPTPATLYVALKAKGAIIGLLEVQGGQAGRFGPAEAELLSLIGNPAAVAIQNARLFSENMERLETITALYVSAQKLSFDRDLERMTQDVVRTCVDSYGAQAVWLARVEGGHTLNSLGFLPANSPQLAQLGVRWNEAVAGYTNPARQAIDSGFPVIIQDLQNDPNFEPWLDVANAHNLHSCIVLPLISRDEPVGILCLFSSEVGFFKPRRQSFFQAYAHHVAVALENTRLIAETGRRLQQLQSLRAIDAAITGSLDLRLNLKIILDQVITQLGSDAADLLILNKNTLALDYAAGRGFLTNARQAMRLLVGQGYAGQVVLSRRPISILNIAEEHPSDETAVFAGEGFASYYAMPLIAKGQVTGVLEIFHRRPFAPDAEWLEFLKSLTEQSAIAIDNASLFAGLQRTNLELALAYDATIEGLSRVMDMRDKEAEGHTQRVTELALSLGERLGLTGEALMHLRRGGLLHDIGKLGVPDQVLLKAEALTPEEWDVLKMHPTYAYQMLSSITYLRPALDIPYCHHERWDGSGYPRGLKGEQIPLAARIFAVVDVWDALVSEKPYRAAWPEEKVRAHIQSLSGISFDPRVVEAFLALNLSQPN